MRGTMQHLRTRAAPVLRLLSSKIARLLGVAAFVILFVKLSLVVKDYAYQDAVTAVSPFHRYKHYGNLAEAPDGKLHLLIPATNTNADLCKLLLSSQILGYPTPVLINYGNLEDADEYVQHLAKVQGILSYLDALEASSGDSLVLIIDGYDIWFQLRPDVLLKRYFALNAAADARNREIYGDRLFKEHDMRQTIVFGPDKICWPPDFSRPACWAVPDATLKRYAFGPETNMKGNEDLNLPSWLNSGSILGPLQDLKDLFRATLDEIHTNHTTDSDQFYFSNIFGSQEYFRLLTKPDLLEVKKQQMAQRAVGINIDEPISTDRKVEYHIGIDYESSMFQTLGFWKTELTWTRAADSWQAPTGQTYGLHLPEDIASSAAPYVALKNDEEQHPASWSEVELNYNAITNQAPVLVHFTGEKRFRHVWWKRIWFQSHAEQLHDAISKHDQRLISPDPIGGIRWYAAEPKEADEISSGGKLGAYTDRRGWLSWRQLCKRSEQEIFTVPDNRFFHAAIEAQAQYQSEQQGTGNRTYG